MSQRATTGARRSSLSLYISLLLALTAVIPLLVTLGSLAIFLRPALVSQISADMERDAQTRIQLIDTYLAERLNDVKTLSESSAVRSLLAGDQNSSAAVNSVLFTALHRDIANYIGISLLDARGNVVQAYPAAPLLHGKYLIPPEDLQQVQQSGKVVISDVFYDQVANTASVDLYARVIDNNFHLLGVVRVSLGLHRLWEPVDSEPQINGTGSYAFILDQHGVRIAYTNPDHSGFTHPPYLFKAIGSLPADFQQRIKDENLYGNSSNPVTTMADQGLVNAQSKAQSSPIFQFDPLGQNQTYEAARYTSTVVPWTYYLLKPLNVVTGLADQQLISVVLIVTLVLFLAVFIGLQTGRRITMPILRSVASLRKNSISLKTLSDEEQVIATEQSWMVEASQVTLQSVKYYTGAASVAARRLTTIGNALLHNSGEFDARRFQRAVKDMVEAAAYIERAIKHQEAANEKLTTSLRVTTQATEQLTRGAVSTDEAATQLENIVRQLSAVVGERETSTRVEESMPVAPVRERMGSNL